jgi:hypothetical protein
MNHESRKAGRNLRNSELIDRIISAAIRVHRELGPGFLEGIYEEALAVEFALSGVQFIRQKPIPLFYKGTFRPRGAPQCYFVGLPFPFFLPS